MRSMLCLLPPLLVMISCGTPDSTPASDIRGEISSQWDGFISSWEAEDAAACAAYYLEDALNIPPQAPIHDGRTAIRDFYQFLFDNNLSSDYQHEVRDLEPMGDQALEYGLFSVNWMRNDSTKWTFRARSLTHWKKDENGDWKIAKFIFNNPPEE